MTDLVSILVPVYNRVELIDKTLQSALAQTHAAIEVVVVDNASTDGTWERLLHLAEADSRLRVFRNPSNVGPVRNWLECVAHARGPFCKILWSDDLISPEFVAATLPLLDDPGVGFAYSAATVFEGNDPGLGKTVYSGLGAGLHSTAAFIEGTLLRGDFPVSPGCALFRTADVRKNLVLAVPNRVNSDFSTHAIGNDLLLLLLTAASYPLFGIVTDALAQFREHAGSISTNSGGGRLQLHYDIAKASFVEQGGLPTRLVRRFNAMLWFDLKRYNGARYGLYRIADFYTGIVPKVEPAALLQVVFDRLTLCWRRAAGRRR